MLVLLIKPLTSLTLVVSPYVTRLLSDKVSPSVQCLSGYIQIKGVDGVIIFSFIQQQLSFNCSCTTQNNFEEVGLK